MYKKLAIAALVSIALYGCGAEERSYDTLPRAQEQIVKSSLDTESLWLYMPSTGATPRYAATQRGFFQGTPKLVKLRFDKTNGIVAEEVDRDTIEPDKDSRYTAIINQAPVLKIPGTFEQYRCAEDDYDECTNKEELNEDADLDWKETTHFTPDYAGVESLAVDTVDAWWTADNVEETAEPRVISSIYDPKKGVLNIEVERTFTASPDDAYDFGGNLEDLSFKTRFFYSMVQLDKLTSDDYQTVQYPGRDSSKFGFFNDEKEQRSLTGEIGLQGQKFNLLHRFNPDKPSIDYYLSDSYFDKAGKFYLDITLETINQMNKTLAGTGVPPIKIVNPTKKAGVHTGDLRYNVLNLITDPVDNGLLGYGPSATNPLTGEIVHAHVNQYAGVIRSTSRRMWDELVMRYNRAEIERPDEYKPEEPLDTANIPSETGASIADNRSSIFASGTPIATQPVVSHEPRFINGKPQWLSPEQQEENSFSKSAAHYTEQLDKMAAQNMYAEEFMWVSTKSKGLIKGIDYLAGKYFDNTELDNSASDYADKANKKLKSWTQLSKDQQQEVSDAITEHMFKSTLVHEFGHNLGLRHNFMGSMDKANFYQDDEVSKLGYDKMPAYSSVMDYGASIFDELPTYGKYDIAALRYGYRRQVEVNSTDDTASSTFMSLENIDEKLRLDHQAYPLGAIDQLQKTIAVEMPGTALKDYRYCTDEHVISTTNCNRFDEGTNVLELTKFRIQKYWDNYDLINRRNGRDKFYDFRLHYYSFSLLQQFSEIRDVIEDLGRIDNFLAQTKGSEDSYGSSVTDYYINFCSQSSNKAKNEVCNTFDASLLAANFFIDVLNKPDKVCEVEVSTTNDGIINSFIPLSDIWKRFGPNLQNKTDLPLSCFDDDLVATMAQDYEPIKVLSETRDGRSLANMRANNPYQSSANAVDLLGVWPDKLLAAQMLVKRSGYYYSSQDRSNMALIDISSPYLSTQGTPQKLKTYLGYLGFGMDSFPDPIFVDKDGKRTSTVKRYVPNIKRAVDVPEYLVGLKRYFQLSKKTVTPMFAALLRNVVAYGSAKEYGLADSSQELIDDITLTQPSSSRDENDSFEFSLKTRRYLITRRNGLAKRMAEKALLINGHQEKLEQLRNANPRTKRNLDTSGLKNINDFKLVMLRDTTALGILKKAPHFESLFRARPFPPAPAKFSFDKENNCYSPAEDSSRCHTKENLLAAWNTIRNYKDDNPEYLETLLTDAESYSTYIADEISKIPEDADIYDIDPEVIWLWENHEYLQYRYALEQLPVL
ncbi:zinc-dependent metalloprotease [Photobacterium lipolyticum]|uniref:ATPase n=1 Tax=Photobacterium lipolyticum TaxID=266810 RepID=A0A2T3MTP8_9GAMM|nr:zinc-dependent metalloprotease [Photobacterium lipolyticum]PSW02677.1 ATPase [Photobacterium lipolyticum]